MCHNLMAQVRADDERVSKYSPETAMLIARTIINIKDELKMKGTCFGQQFLLHEGLKKFGDKG